MIRTSNSFTPVFSVIALKVIGSSGFCGILFELTVTTRAVDGQITPLKSLLFLRGSRAQPP
jgi:uncharacterized membrane protein YgdD (TMEM256/DUF423 family)